MNFKNTKVIQQRSTKRPLQSSELPNITGKPSAELKNTFSSKAHHIQRGLWAEWFCSQYFIKLQYRLLKHRMKTPFAELDLLFETPQKEILIVEVKSIHSREYIEGRLSEKQKRRLLRGMQYVQTQTSRPVIFWLVMVTHKKEVLVFRDFFD